jgi:hypothetical protein
MSDEAASAPSAGSVKRLAADVGGEVADLRTRLHRALDEAGRLEAEGRQDLAAAVLEEQREVLLSVHQRLQGRLADAAVEREAERVVAGATPTVGPRGTGPSTPAMPATSAPAVTGPAGAAVRLLAAVAAAAVGVVLLVTPELGSTVLTVAGLTGAEDPGHRDAAVSGPTDRPSTLGSSAAAPDEVSSVADEHDPAASEATAPVRPHGDSAVRGETSTPSSPAGAGADEPRDGGDRSEFTDLTGFPGLVQEWIDRRTDADRASGDEQRDGDAEDQSSSILPVERSDERSAERSGDAEPDDTGSDDERFLGGR